MAKATREAYGEALAELIRENDKVVVLDADLSGSTKTAAAKKAVPERFFDMGIAEADMIGHAAGFAISGMIPFASTFAIFASGRAWEQIRNSVAYPNLNVKVCATHAGISVGEDGPTHQACEDIALMRVIPGIEIYVPADAAETKAVIRHVAETEGPCYVRLGRSAVDDVYTDESAVDVTKVNVLREGTDGVIFACGQMVQASLKAAEMLKETGLEITVADVCAIKPCDEKAILRLLEAHKNVFTAEEHSVIGGLGGMICEIASRECPRKIVTIGLNDCFAESGDEKSLMKKYGLDAESICKKIKASV